MKNTPASRPRDATTVGIPRFSRNTPRGKQPHAAPGRARRRRQRPRLRRAAMGAATPSSARPPRRRPPVPRAPRPVRPAPAVRSGGCSVRTAGTTRAVATSTNGTSPRNTQCHERVSVTSPDTGGPSSAGSTHAEEMRPNTAGRARSGYTAAISTKIATLVIPAPAPCNTRPTRSCGHARRRPGDQQACAEQQRRHHQRNPRSGPVAPATAQHRGEHRRRHERDERPRVERDAAEVGDERRHRGVHAHRLERHQADEEDDADRRGTPARSEQLGADGDGGLGCGHTEDRATSTRVQVNSVLGEGA